MSRLRVIVLGSAAGGGYPQWNCRGAVSALFWDGDTRVEERSQSSIAVSSDGENWALLNCSPDIRQQIISTPALQPKQPPRHTPLASILLTNGDIDHVAGLLTLRERQAFRLLATPGILEVLNDNRIFDALDRDLVPRQPVALGETIPLVGEVVAEIFPVPGKVPLYMEKGEPEIGAESETTVGVKISVPDGPKLFYIPGCAHVPAPLKARIAGADLLLFDGTLWQDDEMRRAGVGQKTGHRMGHISMSGSDGSIAAFRDVDLKRRAFIHINNTNPVLVRDSPERREAEAAGWDITYDGMEIAL
ncbi:pyrroloquinoline quinone biosynthesis protein PqqB [Algihabitans albus]|uniref:pyrroloquinoline quinone biosynthesis protein PqqB n=1 Tax=Algihabitans albus TaxID=2164067 RepID=UPI000E5D2DC1|nr:pyrroloquinoline quinone biosynthesis protein PqqB [Algihabitans albus]